MPRVLNFYVFNYNINWMTSEKPHEISCPLCIKGVPHHHKTACYLCIKNGKSLYFSDTQKYKKHLKTEHFLELS